MGYFGSATTSGWFCDGLLLLWFAALRVALKAAALSCYVLFLYRLNYVWYGFRVWFGALLGCYGVFGLVSFLFYVVTGVFVHSPLLCCLGGLS